MDEFLGIGWNYPVKRDDPDSPAPVFATAGYHECIRQSIEIILGTAIGERVMRPNFGCGIHDLIFSPNNAGTRGLAESYVSEALQRWEPRIKVQAVKADVGGVEGEIMLTSIDYLVRSTDSRFNLVYPFYLERGRP